MRFLFCAAAISHFLGDWSGFDKDSAVSYISQCEVLPLRLVQLFYLFTNPCSCRAMMVGSRFFQDKNPMVRKRVSAGCIDDDVFPSFQAAVAIARLRPCS